MSDSAFFMEDTPVAKTGQPKSKSGARVKFSSNNNTVKPEPQNEKSKSTTESPTEHSRGKGESDANWWNEMEHETVESPERDGANGSKQSNDTKASSKVDYSDKTETRDDTIDAMFNDAIGEQDDANDEVSNDGDENGSFCDTECGDVDDDETASNLPDYWTVVNPPPEPPPPDDEEALTYLFFVRNCFLDCSAHGFPRAIEAPTQFRKIAWTLFTMCSIGAFFYQASFN